MSTATPSHVPDSLGSMDFSEAKVQFAQAYQADVLGAFERAIDPNLVGKEAISGALHSFFEEERRLAKTHQGTFAGLVGNITNNEKAIATLTKKMQKNHDTVMKYLEKFVAKILDSCGDEVTVPQFAEALKHEIERIRPLQDSEDKVEENKILEMYLARMEKNHEALISGAREKGSTAISGAPRNVTKKPNMAMRALYAIPLTALMAETILSMQGVGQRLLTSSESMVHGSVQEGSFHDLLEALNDNHMLAPASYGTALGCSLLINYALRKSLDLWSTSRKASQIRAAIKVKDGVDPGLTEDVIKRLKNKNFPKKSRHVWAFIGILLASGAITDFVWMKHRQGKLIDQVESKVAGSQIPGIQDTADKIRTSVQKATAQYPQFATKAQQEGDRWITEEGRSGRGPGTLAKTVAIRGTDSPASAELSSLMSTTGTKAAALARQLHPEVTGFGGGDSDATTGFVDEIGNLAAELQTPGTNAIAQIDVLLQELVDMQNNNKPDRKRIIAIVGEITKAVESFVTEIGEKQDDVNKVATLYGDFIKKINDMVNSAYAGSGTRAPTSFTPDTHLPTIDVTELLKQLQEQVPEFKYYSPAEIDTLMDNPQIFTPEEADAARRWALGWGLGVEVGLRIIAFGFGLWLARRGYSTNLTPEDHIEAEKSLDKLVEIMSAMTESEAFRSAFPHIAAFKKAEIRATFIASMQEWKEKKTKRTRKETKVWKRVPQTVGRGLVWFKNKLSKVRPEQDEELEGLRAGFSAIAADENPNILDREFVTLFFEKLLGNPSAATTFAGRIEALQKEAVRRAEHPVSEEDDTYLTKAEKEEVKKSQSEVMTNIPLVKDYLAKTADHIKASPNGDPEEVERWKNEVTRIIDKVVEKLPTSRNLRDIENTKWIGIIDEINRHITFCHDSIVTRAEDPRWETKLATIEAKIV